MTILMILRFLLGFGFDLVARSVRWLADRPVRILIVALLLCCAWLYVAGNAARALAEDRGAQAAVWQGKFAAQKAEMRKFIDMVIAARIEAARLDRANADRVRREWAVTLEKKSHDYQSDLAAMRAAIADRMRSAGTGASANGDPGSRPVPELSGIPILSAGPVRAGEAAIVDGEDIDASTVNTLRLEHLIDAWERAAAINPNRP